MRGPSFLVVLAFGSAAHADVALRIAPFSGRCFDAARLVEGLRARGVTVEFGGVTGQEVTLTARADGLDVRIVARDATGNVTGVEQRHVTEQPCDALRETVELILVRAATPLHFMPDTPRPRRREAPKVVAAPAEAAQAPSEPPVSILTPEPLHVALPAMPPQQRTPVTERVPAPALRVRPHVELGLNGAWSFPLDRAPSEPRGDVEIGVRWTRRLGIALRIGVAKPWRSFDRSGDSAATLEVRRVPIALLLGADVSLRRGHVRLSVGPLLELYAVSTRGVSHDGTDWLAQPALELRAAYRYDVRRVFFEAGLALDAAVLREQLVVTGAGTLSHTPVVDLSPFVGVGVTL